MLSSTEKKVDGESIRSGILSMSYSVCFVVKGAELAAVALAQVMMYTAVTLGGYVLGSLVRSVVLAKPVCLAYNLKSGGARLGTGVKKC